MAQFGHRELPACACGRPIGQEHVSVYRSLCATFLFHRCECGFEWTERKDGIDRSQPVSTDELIEVHLRLMRSDRPIDVALGLLSA